MELALLQVYALPVALERHDARPCLACGRAAAFPGPIPLPEPIDDLVGIRGGDAQIGSEVACAEGRQRRALKARSTRQVLELPRRRLAAVRYVGFEPTPPRGGWSMSPQLKRA